MTDLEAYVALNQVPRLGPITARRLIETLGSPAAIFQASTNELTAVRGIGHEIAQAIKNSNPIELAEKELSRANQRQIQILVPSDAAYPEALRELEDAPLVLYIRGTVPQKWPRSLAIVGSRSISHYGEQTAKKLAYQLAYAGVPIVSGLARGIDSYAHQGALAAQGTTWAVLGCGLSHIYPPENTPLADKIIESGGCLISEFPLDTQPDRQTFPMRNRIISGLSFGVLVIEAGKDSGALITTRFALEQGRQVFAVPGRIDSPHSKGCHQLIKEGAKLVEDAQDILQELQYLFPPIPEPQSSRPIPASLSETERLIFDAIGTEEIPIDHLIATTGLPAQQVSSTLLRLEMKKLIRQLPGKFFVRTA
ncbi:MAG: DNA-processing protein DprA [Verrucomicrobiae bacterium]|nr:DNA-processing protein DprA [Verrucomicrobiae bacterium]